MRVSMSLIYCGCDCGEQLEEFDSRGRKRKYIHGHFIKKFSFKTGQVPWNKDIRGLQIAWNKGISPSKETKDKISKSNKGKPGANKGKTFPPETKLKQSLVRKGRGLGELNPNWKGGSKLSNARQHHNRRSLGHSFINEPFEDSEGHHLDKDYVLYIPRDLHRSIPHNLTAGKNMDLINVKALKWIINYLKEDTGDE